MPPSPSPDDPPPPPPPAYATAIASPLLPAHAPGPSTSTSTSAYATHPAFQHAYADLNLPSSFFLLRNRAQGKALDLRGHKTHEGAEFGVHPIKQPQLKGLSLQNSSNNQLFFLDWDGHLNSAAASRAVEVVDDRLTLAFPHPIMTFPSSLSHPLPRFKLDPSTFTLHVLFSSDPLHRGPNAPDDWRTEDWIVEVLPLRKEKKTPIIGEQVFSSLGGKEPKQLLSELGSKAGGVLSGIGGFFGAKSNPTSPNPSRFGFPSPELPLPPPPVPDKSPSLTSSPLQPPASSSPALPALPSPSLPVPSSSRSPPPLPSPSALTTTADPSESSDYDYDSDSSPSGHRPVRIVRLPPGWREKFPAEALRASPSTSFGVSQWPSGAGGAREKELRKWRRRQWEAVPVTVTENGEERDRAGELLGGDNSGESDSGSEGDQDEYATEEEDAAYLSSLRRVSFPATASAAQEAGQQGAALFTSTLSSAASTAQSTATSAATALSGILSSVVTTSFGRDNREETPSPPLPDLPVPRLLTSSRPSDGEEAGEGEGGGEWGDAAELGREAIEGLGLVGGGVETAEGDGMTETATGEDGDKKDVEVEVEQKAVGGLDEGEKEEEGEEEDGEVASDSPARSEVAELPAATKAEAVEPAAEAKKEPEAEKGV